MDSIPFKHLNWGPAGTKWAWGLAAHLSKASKQTRLVQRKLCFISDAGNRGWGGALYVENRTVTSNSHLQIGGLTSIILIALGTVSLQFQVHLFPFAWGQFLELWLWQLQSGHYVVNFSTWHFGIYKTAPRTWLRILSIVLEKEPKVLDYV